MNFLIHSSSGHEHFLFQKFSVVHSRSARCHTTAFFSRAALHHCNMNGSAVFHRFGNSSFFSTHLFWFHVRHHHWHPSGWIASAAEPSTRHCAESGNTGVPSHLSVIWCFPQDSHNHLYICGTFRVVSAADCSQSHIFVFRFSATNCCAFTTG